MRENMDKHKFMINLNACTFSFVMKFAMKFSNVTDFLRKMPKIQEKRNFRSINLEL